MYNSLCKNSGIKFDFAVITNKHRECKYKIIVDDNSTNYIGFSKYSSNIPAGYDNYIYLDSDIICSGNVSNFLLENNQLGIVEESNYLMNDSDWHRYEYATEQDIIAMSKIFGINAGQFSFKTNSFLAAVRSNFLDKVKPTKVENAKLEQSAFNYAIFKHGIDDCKKLTDSVRLFADATPIKESHRLHHFCGFTGEMTSKYQKMSNFNV